MLSLAKLLPLLFTVAATWLAIAATAEPPRHSNGLTDVVQWDNYTLFVYDQRIFI